MSTVRFRPADDPDAVPVLDAATVMVVRDAADDLEVFMLRRNLRSDFVGGAYVFPGGAVDPDDAADHLEPLCRGRTDAEASRFLGVERGGLAFWVAAIREAFEEAGLLLAHVGDQPEPVRLDDDAERWAEHRRAVDSGERRLVDVCEEEGLTLATDRMHLFSRWITPHGAPRRYDTRFFVVAAPEGQTPLHDDHETIAHLWVRPADALARHEAGELSLIFPTIRTLHALARFGSAAELLEVARAVTDVPAVLPRLVDDQGGVRIVLPGDEVFEALTGRPLAGGAT